METETRVVDEQKDYIVLFKRSGLDTVPLKKEREKPSLLSYAAELYPECLLVGGDNYWEGGVLHRLDRPTSGLVLVARNQKFYDRMMEEQKKGGFIKSYLARTEESIIPEGFPPFPFALKEGLAIHSKFRKYGRGGKAVRPVDPSSYLYERTEREYETMVERIDGHDFYLKLQRGFRHQIRCHLAWSGNAIAGDLLYGGKKRDSFGLFSYALEFMGERVSLL